MPALNGTIIIERDVLERLVESRLAEAKALYEGRCYAGCVYVAGYAVECSLKLAICKVLDCGGLPRTFMSHELDVLLLHSGLERRMKADAPEVYRCFRRIQGFWTMRERDAVRYRDPRDFGENDARKFLNWVVDGESGVLRWLRKQL